MSLNSGHCYGCYTYFYGGTYCEYSIHNNESEGLCPCTTCIIKSMCDKDCGPFAKWTEDGIVTAGLQKALYTKEK